jgi:hypothetical protein
MCTSACSAVIRPFALPAPRPSYAPLVSAGVGHLDSRAYASSYVVWGNTSFPVLRGEDNSRIAAASLPTNSSRALAIATRASTAAAAGAQQTSSSPMPCCGLREPRRSRRAKGPLSSWPRWAHTTCPGFRPLHSALPALQSSQSTASRRTSLRAWWTWQRWQALLQAPTASTSTLSTRESTRGLSNAMKQPYACLDIGIPVGIPRRTPRYLLCADTRSTLPPKRLRCWLSPGL